MSAAVIGTAIGVGKTLGIDKALGGLLKGGGGKKWKKASQNYSAAPDNAVSFFEHSEFRGSYKPFTSGQSVRNLKNRGWNDKISSVKVPRGMKVIVYQHENFNGRSKTIDSDTDLNDQWWNDQITSFRVMGTPVQQQDRQNAAGYSPGGSIRKTAGPASQTPQQAGGVMQQIQKNAKWIVAGAMVIILGTVALQK